MILLKKAKYKSVVASKGDFSNNNSNEDMLKSCCKVDLGAGVAVLDGADEEGTAVATFNDNNSGNGKSNRTGKLGYVFVINWVLVILKDWFGVGYLTLFP